jgi:2,4-dienoyl-CoA reductase-like NADH-dependent reductase (Old Yellow Enzyme family)
VVAPSAIPYSPESVVPKEMTKDDISKFKQDWAAAVKRALKVGFDVSKSAL